MTDFKRRLSRLDSPRAPRRDQSGGEVGPDPTKRDLELGERACQPGEHDSDQQATLEVLRRKMAEVLGREPPPPRPPADLSLTELPFARRETDAGPVYRRLERLAPSHQVGRMPVDAAATASTEMLSLLALDPSLARCAPERALYLDTETTGLGAGAGVVAFLVGLAWFDEERRLVVEQLLLRQLGEERAMLELLTEHIERAELLVSYNGKAFDLPMLAGRLVMNRMKELPERPHLDLLHVGRRIHRARLGACRLVTLESEVLGFVRGEDLDGSDVPPRYLHFLRTGDEQALRAVVDHNAWDLVSLAALVGLYGEPLETLDPEDLAALARTLKRAKALDQAEQAAQAAVQQGGGPEALRVRAQIAKARGDRVSALADFELLSAEVDDQSVRLELAKLYEHHVRQPLKALELAEQGTGESPEALERRRVRLQRKLAKSRRD